MSIQQEHVSFLKELKHTDPYMFRLLSTFDSKLYHIMSALLFDKNNTEICEKAFQEYTKKHGWSTQKDLKGVIKKLNRLILRAPLYDNKFTVSYDTKKLPEFRKHDKTSDRYHKHTPHTFSIRRSFTDKCTFHSIE